MKGYDLRSHERREFCHLTMERNGRNAPESGLRLKELVAPEPVVAARGNKRVQTASDHRRNMVTKECAENRVVIKVNARLTAVGRAGGGRNVRLAGPAEQGQELSPVDRPWRCLRQSHNPRSAIL